MERLKLSTDIYAPPEEIYEFLMDFESYTEYSEYAERVDARGDGDIGTEYEIEFRWWKLSYAARSRVVDLDPPNQIEWKLTKDIVARGRWEFADISEESDRSPASEVSITVQFDPASADPSGLNLPRFVDFDWVLEKVRPLIIKQAETVLRRVTADIEGTPREPEIQVHDLPEDVDTIEDT